MGTYLTLTLKDKTEANIKKVNDSLEEKGIWKQEVYNGVKYGAFITREQLEEDARFMNEDEEGLNQMPSQPRPITTEFLEQFFWNKIADCSYKLSCSENDILEKLAKVSQYCIDNDLIDTKASENYLPSRILYFAIGH